MRKDLTIAKKDSLKYHIDMVKNAEKYQFEVIFVPQEEGGFTVEVPDLPGCISEGDTLEEAEKNIHGAIELYLETLEEGGSPLPKRNKKSRDITQKKDKKIIMFDQHIDELMKSKKVKDSLEQLAKDI